MLGNRTESLTNPGANTSSEALLPWIAKQTLSGATKQALRMKEHYSDQLYGSSFLHEVSRGQQRIEEDSSNNRSLVKYSDYLGFQA